MSVNYKYTSMRLSTLIFNAFAIGRTRTFDVKNWAAVETARTAESRTTRVIIDVTPTTPSLFHSTSKKSNVKNAGGRRSGAARQWRGWSAGARRRRRTGADAGSTSNSAASSRACAWPKISVDWKEARGWLINENNSLHYLALGNM